MKIGDIVKRQPVTFYDELVGKTRPMMKGRVVYIHPKGRYHTVEFQIGALTLRESFKGVEL